jgi:hypothetical protein
MEIISSKVNSKWVAGINLKSFAHVLFAKNCLNLRTRPGPPLSVAFEVVAHWSESLCVTLSSVPPGQELSSQRTEVLRNGSGVPIREPRVFEEARRIVSVMIAYLSGVTRVVAISSPAFF